MVYILASLLSPNVPPPPPSLCPSLSQELCNVLTSLTYINVALLSRITANWEEFEGRQLAVKEAAEGKVVEIGTWGYLR